MSVHSTHYEDEEEYERDLKFEYRKEQWEQDHEEDISSGNITKTVQDVAKIVN